MQGVGYRAWIQHTAARLALSGGRVRNRPDGTVMVEAEAVGRAALEALVAALHRGPIHAQVEAVEATWEEEENVEPAFADGFRIAGSD